MLLKGLEKAQKLIRFVPRTRKGAGRRLYLSANAYKQWTDRSSATNLLCGKGFIDAALTRWGAGDRIYSDEDGKPRFLKELDPPPVPDIWEIRVTDPSPQGRLLGAFLEKDTLVLLWFHTRPMLGQRGSAEWNGALTGCLGDWRDLFGNIDPLHKPYLSDYISENFDDFRLNR